MNYCKKFWMFVFTEPLSRKGGPTICTAYVAHPCEP